MAEVKIGMTIEEPPGSENCPDMIRGSHNGCPIGNQTGVLIYLHAR